jgi:hypothetical protein
VYYPLSIFGRYWMASARFCGNIFSLPARSAMVRASLSLWWYELADYFHHQPLLSDSFSAEF